MDFSSKLLRRAFSATKGNHENHAKISAPPTQKGRSIASSTPVPAGSGRGRILRKAAIQPEPDAELQGVAADYNKKQGLNPPSHNTYAEVDVERAKATADAYDRLVHDPYNPKVRRAYAALLKQTKQQWDHAKDAGYVLEPWRKEGQPYYSSKEMVEDVRKNHHLYYFTGADLPTGHPMASLEPESGQQYNDLFRGVHDLFGHAKGGFEFGPRGEENAFLSHKDMYDEEALPALTTETRGQNSWVNYGKHIRDEKGNIPKRGEPGYKHPADRPYADQKAGILPQL
jgi:hypothetical protein